MAGAAFNGVDVTDDVPRLQGGDKGGLELVLGSSRGLGRVWVEGTAEEPEEQCGGAVHVSGDHAGGHADLGIETILSS